jgi:type IV pilus assembly protein PilP
MLAPLGAQGSAPTAESNQPPIQRVAVAELTVIGIVWGGFGYTAMVQAPDGKGYTVQRGARIGNNNGVVSAITEKAVIVEERFTDIYGKKQVREYAKPLHVKESLP